MRDIPDEIYIMVFGMLWIVIVLSILIIGKRNKRVQSFKDKMMGMWKQSLIIAMLAYISAIIGSSSLSSLKNIWTPIVLFCQCLIGFTIAKSINEYEPLPVTRAIIEHKKPWRKLASMLMFALLMTIVIVVIDQFLPTFGETKNSSQAIKMLPKNKWLLFFTLLYGAGIAEETVYRLIFLSLFWKLTNKKWLSVVLSALLFGAYHLTPINSMYKVYWQFPITQFVSASVGGIIFGYFYVKRGYETAVIGHTFTDWLPILIFMK